MMLCKNQALSNLSLDFKLNLKVCVPSDMQKKSLISNFDTLNSEKLNS